jgi:hypothetical protein
MGQDVEKQVDIGRSFSLRDIAPFHGIIYLPKLVPDWFF